MASSTVEELMSESLGFRLFGDKNGFQIFDSPIDVTTDHNNALQLLTVGHKKGVFAASNRTSIAVGLLRDLDNLDTDKSSLKFYNIEDATHLLFDASQNNLYVVNSGELYIASTDRLRAGDGNFEKLNIETSGPLSVIEPSPLHDQSFLAIDSNGELTAVDAGSLKKSFVEAASWRVDINEILSLSSDPSISNLKEVTAVAVPVYGAAVISNSHAVVAYEEDDEEMISLLNLSSQELSEVPFPPPFGEAERAKTLYSAHVNDWVPGKVHVFVMTSKSTEVNTIELGEKTVYVTQLNDADRAELPMDDESGDDTIPVGFAIDISGTDLVVKQPCMSCEEAKGVLPRLMCLNNMGHLIMWHVFDADSLKTESLSLVRAQESLPGDSKAASSVPKTTTSKFGSLSTAAGEAQANQKPTTTESGAVGFGKSGFDQAGTKDPKPSTFGLSGFGLSGAELKPSAFGLSGFGQTSFGLSMKPDASKTLSGFGKSSFGQSSFGQSSFGQSSFGQSSFGQSSFGQLKPAFGTLTGESSVQSSFSKYGSGSASSSGNPFGSSASTQKPSPFASLSGQSPFGSSANKTNSVLFGSTLESQKSLSLPEPLKLEPSLPEKSSIAGLRFGNTPVTTEPSPFAALLKDTTSLGSLKPPIPNNLEDFTLGLSLSLALPTKNSDSKYPSPFGALEKQPLEKFQIPKMSPGKEEQISLRRNQWPSTSVAEKKETLFGKQVQAADSPVIKEWLSESSTTPLSAKPKSILPGSGDFSPGKVQPKETAKSLFSPSLINSGSEDQEDSKAVSREKPLTSVSTGDSSKPSKSSLAISHASADEVTPEAVPERKSSGELKLALRPEPSKEATPDPEPEIIFRQLLEFDGFSVTPQWPTEEVPRMISELVDITEGELKVLESNIAQVGRLFAALALSKSPKLSDDLETGQEWSLGDLRYLARITLKLLEESQESLQLGKSADTKIGDLITQNEELSRGNQTLYNLVNHLAQLHQTLKSDAAKKLPLELHLVQLRLKLRQKFARVQKRLDEAESALMGMILYSNVDQNTLERLQKVVFDISASIALHTLKMAELHSHKKETTLAIEDVKAPVLCPAGGLEKKWQLAARLVDDVPERNINL